MMNVMLINLIILREKHFLQHVFIKWIPYKKIDKTPYKLWKDYQPNLKYLNHADLSPTLGM